MYVTTLRYSSAGNTRHATCSCGRCGGSSQLVKPMGEQGGGGGCSPSTKYDLTKKILRT